MSRNLPMSPWEGLDIPYDETPLGMIFDLVNGSTPKSSESDYWDGEVVWLTPTDIDENGISRLSNSERKITSEGYESCGLSMVPEGSIVLTTRAPIGNLAIAGSELCTNQGCTSLVPRDERDTRFYAYALLAAKDYLEVLGEGATFTELSSSSLAEVRVPNPPPEVRLALVNSLETRLEPIRDAISNCRNLIKCLNEKAKTTIRNGVLGRGFSGETYGSGVDWIGKIPEHWEVVRTRFVAELHSGHTPDRSNDEYWEVTNIPWVTTSDIKPFREGHKRYLYETENQISQLGMENSGAHLLPKGTVFLSRTASVGFSGIMGKPMATSQDFANWVCGDEIIPEYLLYVFRSMDQEFERLMQGSTHKTIYMPDIESFKTPLPPLDEQREIVEHIESETERHWELIDRVEESIDLLEEKRQALITAAVTGQIDVSEEQDVSQAPT